MVFTFMFKSLVSFDKLDHHMDNESFISGSIEITNYNNDNTVELEVETYNEDADECEIQDDLIAFFDGIAKIIH